MKKSTDLRLIMISLNKFQLIGKLKKQLTIQESVKVCQSDLATRVNFLTTQDPRDL